MCIYEQIMADWTNHEARGENAYRQFLSTLSHHYVTEQYLHAIFI